VQKNSISLNAIKADTNTEKNENIAESSSQNTNQESSPENKNEP
jgi:hypothetical protein